MSLEIGAFVLGGQLDNSRRNSVFGYIQLADDYFLHLQLTGNAEHPLNGFAAQFTIASKEPSMDAPLPEASSLPVEILKLSRRQAGVCERLAIEHQSEDSEEVLIHIQWFGQNGHVTANLHARLLEIGDSSDEDDDIEPFSEIEFEETEDEDDEPEDPFGLFSEDLEEKLASATGIKPQDGSEADGWDELTNPDDLDAETRALHAQWDEIFSGKKDQPLPYLFEKTLKLPKPDAVETDEEAWPLVVAILEQLAKLSFVLDVCEHFTPMQTYRLLMEEVLPNAQVHPNLAASEIVQHYSTSDFCAKCEAEFDIDADDTLGEDSGD